jgi:TonB family protein
MREIPVACAFLVLGCLFSAPPALESFPARPGVVFGPDCCGRPTVREEPRYPDAANGQSGWVIVSGVLDERGWVTEPRVLASEPAGVFDAAALAAFDAWRYATAPDAAAAPREVRELLRFERRHAPSAMPSEGGSRGGGGYGY